MGTQNFDHAGDRIRKIYGTHEGQIIAMPDGDDR